MKTRFWGKREKIVDSDDAIALVIPYAVNLKHDKRLTLCDSKVCYTKKGVVKIKLDFITQDIIELRDARHVLVDVVEGFIDRVNNDGEFLAQVENVPMTADELEIHIDYESFFGRFVDPTYNGWTVLRGGIAYFNSFELKDPESNHWGCRYEAYSKTRKIVEVERGAEEEYRLAHPPEETPSFISKNI